MTAFYVTLDDATGHEWKIRVNAKSHTQAEVAAKQIVSSWPAMMVAIEEGNAVRTQTPRRGTWQDKNGQSWGDMQFAVGAL